jgi:prepilin signal peptidase PulO-like enzyme (type II secretory pathway)
MEGSVALPFGAFLCVAGIYALFVGQRIIYWYLGFFR